MKSLARHASARSSGIPAEPQTTITFYITIAPDGTVTIQRPHATGADRRAIDAFCEDLSLLLGGPMQIHPTSGWSLERQTEDCKMLMRILADAYGRRVRILAAPAGEAR